MTAPIAPDEAAAPVIRLRPHHLLCMLTFVGKGYSPGFIARMAAIVAALGQGAGFRLMPGPDDICAAHLADSADAHCHDSAEAARDEAALAGLSDLLAPPDAGGVHHLDAGAISAMRQAFAAGTSRAACASCSWHALCSDIAGAGFVGAHLGNAAP